ncbi:MAG TPA: hypothetical protein PK033_14660 [Acetivibrio sp.]|jgi:hypothetical protein|nr:hypothetical protein [Acetivibrio sp.]
MKTRNCYVCGIAINDKDHIGLNRKLLGRKVERFYCIDCLAEYFEVTTEELLDRIEEFKAQGCSLFAPS